MANRGPKPAGYWAFIDIMQLLISGPPRNWYATILQQRYPRG